MVKFTVEQKLQALNLLKEGYSSCSVAQIIGAGSHQTINTWAEQYQHFAVQGLEIYHTTQNYGGYFKLQVLNWRKEHDQTYQNTAIHFKISSPSLFILGKNVLLRAGLMRSLPNEADHRWTNHLKNQLSIPTASYPN